MFSFYFLISARRRAEGGSCVWSCVDQTAAQAPFLLLNLTDTEGEVTDPQPELERRSEPDSNSMQFKLKHLCVCVSW